MPRSPSKTINKGLPTVTISRRGSARLRAGHVWVYRSDLLSTNDAGIGSLVEVADERGKSLGTAFYSSSSQISIRMVSRGQVQDLSALFRQRIRAAIAYRERVVQNTNTYRV